MLKITRLVKPAIIVCLAFGIFSCSSSYKIQDDRTETGVFLLDSASGITDDPEATALINPYKVTVDAEMSEILAYSEIALVKNQPEGLLNNFISDLVLKKSDQYFMKLKDRHVDICLLNNGGLRSSLPKGAVTRRDIYQLMPFENESVVLTMTGKDTKYMMNFIARSGGMPLGGATMGIDGDTATNILIGGNPIDLNKTYNIVTSDYLAEGGDEMFFFSKPIEKINLRIRIRDMIIEYLKEENALGNTITSKLDNRIYYEK